MDPEVPARYIRENFRPEDRIAVILIERQTQHVTQRISTADRIAQPQFQAWLRHENASRRDVYVGMNPVKDTSHSRTKADIAEIRHVYLDFDHNGDAAVKALSQRGDVPTPNYLVNTSPDHWQVVWKVEGFAIDEAERLMRHLVRETGADPAATDSSRVLRVPGFISHKHASPFLVRVESKATETYRPEHFPKCPTEEPGARRVTANSDASRPVSSGHLSQSEKDWSYAKRALGRGDDPEKVIRDIATHRRGEKHDPVDYATRTVRRASGTLEAERGSSPDR